MSRKESRHSISSYTLKGFKLSSFGAKPPSIITTSAMTPGADIDGAVEAKTPLADVKSTAVKEGNNKVAAAHSSPPSSSASNIPSTVPTFHTSIFGSPSEGTIAPSKQTYKGLRAPSSNPTLSSSSNYLKTPTKSREASTVASGLLSNGNGLGLSLPDLQPDDFWVSSCKPQVVEAMKSCIGTVNPTPVQYLLSSSDWLSGNASINYFASLIIRTTALPRETAPSTIEISDLKVARVTCNPQHLQIEIHTTGSDLPFTKLTLEFSDNSSFYTWTASLLLHSNLKSSGLQNKLYSPSFALGGNTEAVLVLPVYALLPALRKKQWRASGIRQSNSSTGGLSRAETINGLPRASSLKNIASHGTAPNPYSSSFVTHDWIPVIAILRRNGRLDLIKEADGSIITGIDVSKLFSSGIRKLDFSVYDINNVLFIGNIEAPSIKESGEGPAPAPLRPSGSIMRKLSSKREQESCQSMTIVFQDSESLDNWSHATKSLARVQVYTPSSGLLTHSLRFARKISLRIIEARFGHSNRSEQRGGGVGAGAGAVKTTATAFHSLRLSSYVEVQFANMVWGRTAVVQSSNPFWREDFVLTDLPVSIPNLKLIIKRRLGSNIDPKTDPVLGEVSLSSQEVFSSSGVEEWFPMKSLDQYQESYGPAHLLAKITFEQLEVLSADHYDKLEAQVLDLRNGLSLRISETVKTDVSDIFLNIYGTQAPDWIEYLIQQEIISMSGSINANNDGKFHHFSTLFRGNSLLTKSLERFMKSVGHDYLEAVIGPFVRLVVEREPWLEIDPSRVTADKNHPDVLVTVQQNQQRLEQYCTKLWKLLWNSTDDLPWEIKRILNFLRSELIQSGVLPSESSDSEDFLTNGTPRINIVVLNSISGFLFLRFFCPALLNPKLFGLTRNHQTPKCQRSLTLITKMLQGFANRVRFGMKEPFMIPMNKFIDKHEHELFQYFERVAGTSTLEASFVDKKPMKMTSTRPFILPKSVLCNPKVIEKVENFAALVGVWSSQGNGSISESVIARDTSYSSIASDSSFPNASRWRHCIASSSSESSPSTDIRSVSTSTHAPDSPTPRELSETNFIGLSSPISSYPTPHSNNILANFDAECIIIQADLSSIRTELVLHSDVSNWDSLVNEIAETYLKYNCLTGDIFVSPPPPSHKHHGDFYWPASVAATSPSLSLASSPRTSSPTLHSSTDGSHQAKYSSVSRSSESLAYNGPVKRSDKRIPRWIFGVNR